jgi:septum formation protein
MLPLLLASASPRRRALLEEMGMAFEVVTVAVVELTPLLEPKLRPAELAEANARLKAMAAMKPGRWTLGADTVVALDGVIFGKPASLGEAREFLRALSGRTHQVITGCALINDAGLLEIFHETSRVTFHPLTDKIIDDYLAKVAVLDKAGGYALQEQGHWLVEQVEGSRENVIGLPVDRLKEFFRTRGLL